MTDQIAGRDPIAKTMVESFVATYPRESDEQIFERIKRAWRSAGATSELPMTIEVVARWRL